MKGKDKQSEEGDCEVAVLHWGLVNIKSEIFNLF